MPPLTGKTGADGFAKAVKRQSLIWAHYGPKLRALVVALHASGVLDTVEYTALINGFDALPTILAAIVKVAEHSGF